MLNDLLNGNDSKICAKHNLRVVRFASVAACALAVLALMAGCQTAPSHGPHSSSPPQAQQTPTPPPVAAPGSTNDSKSLILQEGDMVKIAFPGAPNLDATEVVRRDGKITLEMIGEYDAAGKTPAQMEADLKNLYHSQLVNNEVTVTVQSSAFVIYVMGAVARPGKVVSERPLTVLEALIESGIDETKSNLKAVTVIRTDTAGHTVKTKLDLHKFLHHPDAQMPSFTLKPYDVINVPERFNFY